MGLELCAGLAVLPGTLRARGDTTTPPGTLSELCDTSWIFVRFSQYNQPTASLPNGRSGFGTPCGRTPHGSLRSRFFVSPLIGGAQQRGLRPRHSLAVARYAQSQSQSQKHQRKRCFRLSKSDCQSFGNLGSDSFRCFALDADFATPRGTPYSGRTPPQKALREPVPPNPKPAVLDEMDGEKPSAFRQNQRKPSRVQA